jgi:mRNA-degrading endonuclease RelE of RelBE toxin-antitoxin system
MVMSDARNRFRIIYAHQVKEHLVSIERKHHSLIRRAIESHLLFEPEVEARNRKPLKRPADLGADWEIRFGPGNRFRVFYSVDIDQRIVLVLAIGVKTGNRLVFGREEIKL